MMNFSSEERLMFLVTYDKWQYFASTGECNTINWEHEKELEHLLNSCMYCQTFMENSTLKGDMVCGECPLQGINEDIRHCCDDDYIKWYSSETKDDRKMYARRIRDRQTSFLNSIGFEII